MMKEANALQKPIMVRTSLDDNRPEWTKKTVYEKRLCHLFHRSIH